VSISETTQSASAESQDPSPEEVAAVFMTVIGCSLALGDRMPGRAPRPASLRGGNPRNLGAA